MTINPVPRRPSVRMARHVVGSSMVVAGATLALLGAFTVLLLAVVGAVVAVVGYAVAHRWTRRRPVLVAAPNFDYDRRAA